MKVIAFNGSPRKKWNTATLLENVLDGARAKGAQCELVHLYDVGFKGCVSCFECKKIDPSRRQGGRTAVFERGCVSLAVDCAVFGFDDESLKVLAVRRAVAPFAGSWVLPGGFVETGETLLGAAARELEEETGIAAARLEQVGCFDALGRDPRGRVVSVALAGLVRREHLALRATADAREVRWWDLADRPPLAFDHEAILAAALAHVRAGMWRRPLVLELLGERFTLAQARTLYAAVSDAALDVRNFRKRLLATGMVVPLEARETGVAHRAARFYALRDAKRPGSALLGCSPAR